MAQIDSVIIDATDVSKTQLRKYLGKREVVVPTAAVGDGVADDTAAFVATAALPAPRYVGPGTYKVASGTALDGFYGPGVILKDGRRWPLPASPADAETARAIVDRLSMVRANSGMIVYLGDSITHAVAPVDVSASSFVTKMHQALDLACGLENEEAFFNWASVFPFGITLSGSVSAGVSGPIKQSIILAPGGKIAFSGKYSFIDVWYNRAPSAGTLTFRKDGVGYRTLICSGTAAPDVLSFPGATSYSSVASYEIENTGSGNVEIIGLLRINFAPAAMGAIYHARLGASGQSTSLIGDAQLDSILRIMAGIDTGNPAKSLMVFFHGINNYQLGPQTTTVDQYRADCRRIFSRTIAAGHMIVAIAPVIPDIATFPGSDGIGKYIGALYEVCGEYGITVVPSNGIDFLGLGLLSDGLHPTAEGHDRLFRLLSSTMANGLAVQTTFDNGSYTPAITGQTSYTAQIGRFAISGALWSVRGQIDIGTAAAHSGVLTVSLPGVAALAAGVQCGSIGRAIGFAAPAGGSQFTIEAIPGTATAAIRVVDVAAKNVVDVTSIDNGASLTFTIDYLVQ